MQVQTRAKYVNPPESHPQGGLFSLASQLDRRRGEEVLGTVWFVETKTNTNDMPVYCGGAI